MPIMDKEQMSEWVSKVGGLDEAVERIRKVTGLKRSTAEKIAAGRYPSTPGKLIREALNKLTKRMVFPLVGASEKAS